jgi:hypothetical protein
MDRDGYSLEEAKEMVVTFRKEAIEMMNNGASMESLEDKLMDDFMLEPDYLFGLIF